MKALFRLSIVVSLLTSVSLKASEYEELLLEESGEELYNIDYTFHEPKFRPLSYLTHEGSSTETYYFSNSNLDNVCEYFKAGTAINAELGYFKTKKKVKGVNLIHFFEGRWVLKEFTPTTAYIKTLNCNAPTREKALVYLLNELDRSKGGSVVSVTLFNKLEKLYPNLVTRELAKKFLISELKHRYQCDDYVNSRNFRADLIKRILELYPDLRAIVGPY